jgi:Na+-driven multidrug efflux pump
MMFPFSIILGFGSGFQPVAGFNWGARRYDRVTESYRFSAVTAFVGAAVMALVLGVFAPQVITLFNAEADMEMQRLGALCIRMQCIALPIHAWVAIVNGFCSGLGYGKYAVILATSRQGSCFMPIVFPMAMLGAVGVASVQAVADCLTLILAIPILRRMWKNVDAAEEKLRQERLTAETAAV